MNWAVPATTFPKFVDLLALPTYTYNVLLGLTVSVGGLTESLVSFSLSVVFVVLPETLRIANVLKSHTRTVIDTCLSGSS